MKEFADDNFKFDENGRKLSKRVENTVRKGEIARYEQFLLFPQCFQKACFPGASKGVVVWEWVKRVLRSEARYVLFRIACPYAAGTVEDSDVAIPSSPDLTEYVVLSVSDAAESLPVAAEEPEVFLSEQGSGG